MAKKVSNERHWGITVLSILGYIGAVATLLAGIILLLGSAYLGNLLAAIPAAAGIGAAIATLGTIGFIVLGIIFIGLSILDYFIAKGLWDGKNWARIIMLIFAALSVLGSLWPFNIVSLVIDGLIVWYLGFYKPAVKYFK